MLGFLNINKPSGMTSSDVVVKLRRRFRIQKIGHMGTLDPMASGVLAIAVGKATRMFDYFLDKTKKYIAQFQFGYTTDTLDSEGEIVQKCDIIPKRSELETVLRKYIGKHAQIPPKYSAKSVNGVKAYKLAREGVEVELKAKEVEIVDLQLIDYIDGVCTVSVECSSGTYIRALGRDIAAALNTVCTMTSLVRSQSGVFDLSNALDLDDILQRDSIDDCLFAIEDVFPQMPRLELTVEELFKLRNGVQIDNIYGIDRYCFVIEQCNVMCVAENTDNKLKIKTYLAE